MIGERTGLMKRRIAIAALVFVLVVAGCGHGSTRDPVADARNGLDQVKRGTVHVELEMVDGRAPSPSVGFATDGTFDLGPTSAARPATDVMTVNLGTPDDLPSHFVSTGQDAFIVQGDVGYQLKAMPLPPAQPVLDLPTLLGDLKAQPPTTTAAGDAVDRVTGGVDPVATVNGVVDLADRLGAGPDAALRVSPADAARVRGATRSSTVEVLTGRDDHLLRSFIAHIELATTTPSSPPFADAMTGGAVVHALRKLGQVTLTVEVRLDDPNAPVVIAPPATIRPISELGGS